MQTPTASDPMVDHPSYYGGEDNVYEVIKILEHYELGFHLGSAVKYILRAGRKNPTTFVKDLRKARWYLTRMIEQTEAAIAYGEQALDDLVASAQHGHSSPIAAAVKVRRNGRKT